MRPAAISMSAVSTRERSRFAARFTRAPGDQQSKGEYYYISDWLFVFHHHTHVYAHAWVQSASSGNDTSKGSRLLGACTAHRLSTRRTGRRPIVSVSLRKQLRSAMPQQVVQLALHGVSNSDC